MANMAPAQAGREHGAQEESSFVNVGAWTEEAMRVINRLQIASPSVIRGTSVSLSIPLDGTEVESRDGGAAPTKIVRDGLVGRPSELKRRDSLKRRDAVLKGREGSRRRQRWENGG
jgi:hypothetical protein